MCPHGPHGRRGGTLVDVATGLPVRDNGQGTQLTGTAGAATRWGWHGGGGGQMPAPPGFTTRIFEDQFTGPALDASKWVTYVGDRGIRWNDRGLLPAPYSGFNQPGATSRAIYSPAQLTVGNGLAITAQRNTGPYSGTYPWVYHVYGVRFIPGRSVTYYFDGTPKFTVTAAGGVSIPALPYEIMLNMAVGSPVSSSYHTVPGSSTPRYVMRVAEVQAWTP